MYALGDRYDIPSLKSLARERFTTKLKISWDSDEIPGLIDVVSSTPGLDRGLRDGIVELLRDHGRKVFGKQEIQQFTKQAPGFAFDAAIVALGGRPKPTSQSCFRFEFNGFAFKVFGTPSVWRKNSDKRQDICCIHSTRRSGNPWVPVSSVIAHYLSLS